MKHLFIINPVAGKGKALKLVPEIRKLFWDREDECFTEVTERPGHAAEIARKYTRAEKMRVYSVGGDGTLNEILNGMAESGSSLAVIPAGSGNDFVRSIGTFKNVSDVLYNTVYGHEKSVDLAVVNGMYFINIASIGFDAEVVYNTDMFKKLPLISGSFAYILGILSALIRLKSNKVQINIDGVCRNSTVLLVAVANGKYYGGGMLVAPQALVDDGSFDICLIEKMSRPRILRFLPEFIAGRHGSFEGVSFHRGKNIEITSDEPIMLNADGELKRVNKALFRIIPKGINVVVPC